MTDILIYVPGLRSEEKLMQFNHQTDMLAARCKVDAAHDMVCFEIDDPTKVTLKQFTDRGWESDVGFIRPDETVGPTVERQLRSTNYDCVVIGGGVRLPPRNLALFEVVINAIRKAAPGAAIAFNTRPDDSADAAARWLAAGSPPV